MTNEELTAIEARAAAATPGEWALIDKGDIVPVNDPNDYICIMHHSANDADFIIRAHNTDIPALCAEVRRLQEEVEKLQAFASKAVVKYATASSEVENLKIQLEHAYDVGLPGLPPRDVDPQLYEDMGLE